MKDASLSRKVKTILNISKCQPGNTMTRFAAFFVFRVRSARNPHQSSVTTIRVTLFYSAGPHGNRCRPQPAQEKLGRGFGKYAGEWTVRVEISQEEIPGSRCSMRGYILTHSRF